MNVFTFGIMLSVCDGYRILCLLPYPGKSHHMVFEPLLEELTRRGHHLTVVSFFPSTNTTNRRDVSLIGLADLNVEVVDLKDFERSYFGFGKFLSQFFLITKLAKSNLNICNKLLSSDVFEEFVKAEGQYDVILLEHFNSDCMLGLVHNYRLASVGLMSCAMMPWTLSRVGGLDNPAFFPNLMLPITNDMSFTEMLVNAFYTHFYNIWFEYAIRRDEQIIVERGLRANLPNLADIGKDTSVVLVNTHYSWNGVRVVPPSVVEVGGIHLHNRIAQPLPELLQQWTNQAQHGFIIFSFGSLIRGSSLPPKHLATILKVFASIKQRVVWKWENEELKDLPSNVLIVKWLPQYDLLRHPNCVGFITHGGMLSLTEAVAAGIPAMVVPVLGDQPGNAAHARKAGFAEILTLDDFKEKKMYKALQKVLSPEMRARAKAISEIWWDRPLSPMDTAVYYVEKTARYGGLNMSSHARRISGIQIALINSLGVLTVVIMVSIVIGCCYCKRSYVKIAEAVRRNIMLIQGSPGIFLSQTGRRQLLEKIF